MWTSLHILQDNSEDNAYYFFCLTCPVLQSVWTILPPYTNLTLSFLNNSAHFPAGKMVFFWGVKTWLTSVPFCAGILYLQPCVPCSGALCPRVYYHMKLEILFSDCEKLKAGAVFSFFWYFYLGPWLFYRREPWVREVKQSSLGHTAG